MIKDLSLIYSKYNIYPYSSFSKGTPVQLFRDMFPENHYARDLSIFLNYQKYAPKQRGADLPWWGRRYFTPSKGYRIFIISQDSLSPDSGSVVFYAHLFPIVKCEGEYISFTKNLKVNKPFSFKSYIGVRQKILSMNIDFDYVFLTDAAKVYKENPSPNDLFDQIKSKELLIEEINYCKPNLILILGSKPLSLLMKNLSYRDCVENQSYLNFKGIKCVVSPFICGQGLAQKNFKERFANASFLMKNALQ